MLQGPLEALDVGGAEAQFALALQNVKAAGKLTGDEVLDNGSRAIRTSVVDDQNVEFLLQTEHGTDNFLYVFLLVVCRNDYYAITHILLFYSYKCKNTTFI